MRPLTFNTGVFDYLGREESEEIMGALIETLVTLNRKYLRRHPETPSLYRSGVRYLRELNVEEFCTIPAILKGGASDCFPAGTLLLRDDYELVPVEDLRPGMRIWGRDKWSTVERSWYKGILECDAIRLNNGDRVKLTPDHHVYVAVCRQHEHVQLSKSCSCRMDARDVRRVTVTDLEPGMVLVAPERIPFGSEHMDPDRAYVEGLFVSDGWSSTNREFCISGQDGCPKEAQKFEVVAICERLGIPTRWHRKSVAVKDPAWTLRVQQMGGHAPEKHALSLNLDAKAAAELLRGIMADSGVNACGNGSRHFSSTSYRLYVQTRVLHRMFGISCGSDYFTQDQHKGFGTHPIWWLSTRRPQTKQEKLLRVKEVVRGVMSLPCWDITTDDHYVYLPEHDVTVSNCEDLAAWRVAELQEREGEEGAQIDVQSADSRDGMGRAFKMYHVRVKRADGKIEDPSAILGMRRVVPNSWNPVPGVATEVAEVGAKLVRLYRQGSTAARGFIARMHELSDGGDREAHRLLVLLKKIDDFENLEAGSDD